MLELAPIENIRREDINAPSMPPLPFADLSMSSGSRRKEVAAPWSEGTAGVGQHAPPSQTLPLPAIRQRVAWQLSRAPRVLSHSAGRSGCSSGPR